MTRAIVFLILLALIPTAFAQMPMIGFSGGGGSTANGGFQGNATFNFPIPSQAAVKNAPYSGHQTTITVQTLADGTHIKRETPSNGSVWRDSQGRIRMERSLFGGNSQVKGMPTLVEISDPVAGYIYIMDDVNRVAHRVKLLSPLQQVAARLAARGQVVRQAPPAPPSTGGGSGGVVGGVLGGIIGAVPAGASNVIARSPQQMTTENLGTQVVDGVTCTGTRTSRVIPVDSEGNDAPITVTNEQWYSAELQLTMLTVNNDPRNGVQTTKIADFSRNEPDPTLFMVPAGYTIVDETTESFTITWGK